MYPDQRYTVDGTSVQGEIIQEEDDGMVILENEMNEEQMMGNQMMTPHSQFSKFDFAQTNTMPMDLQSNKAESTPLVSERQENLLKSNNDPFGLLDANVP